MLLQTVSFPPAEGSLPFDMFLRTTKGRVQRLGEHSLLLQSGAVFTTDTYFGAFFASKWLRYTVLSGLKLRLHLRGRAAVRLFSVEERNGQCLYRDILAEDIGGDDTTEHTLDFGTLEGSRIYAFELSAPYGDAELLLAQYVCDDNDSAADIHIAADICTCRREMYVERNLSAIRSGILENDASPLKDRLSVYIIDNGNTLDADALSGGQVHVLPNRNTGGSGGFTRGIMEIMARESKATHILLMDDDAVILPEVLERTLAFLRLLRPEHRDLTIAGALLNEHLPWIQYEAGARWSEGRIDVLGHDLDLRPVDSLLKDNDRFELIDYSGWWFTCIPVQQVKKIGLPMPFFLHRDDVEYGLRLGGRFVTVSGICVWHEAFERKLSGISEYYDLRNLIITNALHESGTCLRSVKRFLSKWFLRNLFSHRYNYIEMNLAGIADALRGPEWFLEQDGEELHKRVAAMNYVCCDVRELPAAADLPDLEMQLEAQRMQRFSGKAETPASGTRRKLLLSLLTTVLFGGLSLPKKESVTLATQPTPVYDYFRSGRIIHSDATGRGFQTERDRKEILRCLKQYRSTVRLLKKQLGRVSAQYRERREAMCSEEHWRKYLGLE
ncbi:MAG: glycosyltransferase family 2 protein [Ruminococcaceae bacterium]|nr:glycosyltransferase family 2 protein [Oscillospiraceae bacterium]